jgi:hypothetical protein
VFYLAILATMVQLGDNVGVYVFWNYVLSIVILSLMLVGMIAYGFVEVVLFAVASHNVDRVHRLAMSRSETVRTQRR